MDANSTVDIQIGNPHSSAGETWVEVNITDGPSGVPLASFRIDPADWYGLLHGGVRQGVPAFVTRHVERIGKKYEARTVPAPDEYRWDRAATPDEVIAATTPPADWPGFDQARLNRTNSGPTITFMRWVDIEPAGDPQ